MKKQEEYQLQKRVCAYLNAKHPQILYMTDSIAAVKLTLPQASRNKAVQKPNFKCPDLIILQPNDKYSGCFIELKVKSVFKKNGDLFKSDHLKAQQKSIDDLNSLGYYACFSFGYENTVKVIESYLKNEL